MADSSKDRETYTREYRKELMDDLADFHRNVFLPVYLENGFTMPEAVIADQLSGIYGLLYQMLDRMQEQGKGPDEDGENWQDKQG